MKSGKIKFYNNDKGYGFIVPNDGTADIFFHITGIGEGQDLAEGDSVSYEEETGKKGLKAVGIKLHDSVNNY